MNTDTTVVLPEIDYNSSSPLFLQERTNEAHSIETPFGGCGMIQYEKNGVKLWMTIRLDDPDMPSKSAQIFKGLLTKYPRVSYVRVCAVGEVDLSSESTNGSGFTFGNLACNGYTAGNSLYSGYRTPTPLVRALSETFADLMSVWVKDHPEAKIEARINTAFNAMLRAEMNVKRSYEDLEKAKRQFEKDSDDWDAAKLAYNKLRSVFRG